jgi:hypothetical protein
VPGFQNVPFKSCNLRIYAEGEAVGRSAATAEAQREIDAAVKAKAAAEEAAEDAAAAAAEAAVGRCTLMNSVDPIAPESAWFQVIALSSDILVSKEFPFRNSTCTATPRPPPRTPRRR